MRRDISGAPAGQPPPEGAQLPFHVVGLLSHFGANPVYALVDECGAAFEIGDYPTRGAAQRVASHYNNYDRGKVLTDLLLRPAGPGATIR